MGEKQEKVWVVMRDRSWHAERTFKSKAPVKVFDDRSDARSFAKSNRSMSKRFEYTVVGVLKG